MSNENIEENKNEGLMANTSPQVEQEAPNPEETVIPHLEDDNKDQTGNSLCLFNPSLTQSINMHQKPLIGETKHQRFEFFLALLIPSSQK